MKRLRNLSKQEPEAQKEESKVEETAPEEVVEAPRKRISPAQIRGQKGK